MFLDRETNLLQACRQGALQLSAWLLLLPLYVGAAVAAIPGRIDLDRFDDLKKTVALPNGETLAYLELGDPAGQPVVLVHGYTDSARDWAPLVPFLSPRFRLILIDLRGHGRSGKPECCYTRFDFAYDIKLLLDALAVTRADILGHSLGSFVAQTFAEEWPERTARVVLISSSGCARPGSRAPPSAHDYAAEIRGLHEPIDPDSPFMIEWWSSPTPVDSEFLRRQRRDAAAIPLRVWLAVLDQAIDDCDLQRSLPRLTAPTLLLWGARDPIMGEEVRQTLREALPRARVRILPALGHNPFWEDPGACAAEINMFLGGVPESTGAPP